MVIKINQLNSVCEDLEMEVLELKETIWRKLEEERSGLELN